MKIKTVIIKNFRGINSDGLSFDCENLNLLIGDNGTSKTTILESINLCLSSSYASSKLSIQDFYCGTDNPITIEIIFEDEFNVGIPDGFYSQNIKCKGIVLTAKKRDRSAPGKAFNDLVVVEHYFLPSDVRGKDGWSLKRKTGTVLTITERQLSITYASADTPKSFYFGKNRDRQLQKGFNSSMTNILDDLNWRFEKKDRTKNEPDKFKNKVAEIEKYINENTDGDTLLKTIEATNVELKKINIDPIDLSIIRTLTPYDNSEIVKRFDGFELPISDSGSGIEMVTALIFLETLAKISRSQICIIIDEPELHLHPTLQTEFSKHLYEETSDSQIFISTHSPFFFKSCYDCANTKVLATKNDGGNLSISDAKDKGFGLLKWSPSWGEICYFAYELPTIEFHDDLYASLQDKHKLSSINGIETWFLQKGQTKEKKWVDSLSNNIEETLMTFIRNRIHHGDNLNRPMYSQDELKESINRMITLLNNN